MTTIYATQEARRYLTHAKCLLRDKARKSEGYYQDPNYVKMAGHTAYTGVLVALDQLLGKKTKDRKDVDWYKQQLAALDWRRIGQFTSLYDTLQMSMGYDGNPSASVATAGLSDAEDFIQWIEQQIRLAEKRAFFR